MIGKQVCENAKKENWIRRNYPFVFFLIALFSHKYVAQGISFQFYFGIVSLSFANVYFLTQINTLKKNNLKISKMFLRVNLLALSAVTIFVVTTSAFIYAFDYFINFIPERISDIFAIVLFVCVFFYLIGVAFHYLEISNLEN